MGEQEGSRHTPKKGTRSHGQKDYTVRDTDGHRTQRMDDMDLLVRQAQDQHLLKGALGRTILSNYEGHKGLKWDGRTYSAAIIGGVIIVSARLLHAPRPVLVVMIVLWVLVLVVFWGNSVRHLVRMFGLRYGDAPLPDDPPVSAKGSTKERW